MALSAKEKTFKTLADNGWVLDTAETVKKLVRRGSYATQTENEYADVQDPYAFVKPAVHGGTWHVRLDYSSGRYSYGSGQRNATLKSVRVVYKIDGQPVEIELGEGWRQRGMKLSNTDKSSYDGVSYLWAALRWKDSGDIRSLREAADVFFKNPELAILLAVQEKYKADVNHWLNAKTRWETEVAKARPLPVTIPMPSRYEGNNDYYRKGGWYSLTSTLRSAAQKIEYADGQSDLPQLVADASAALQEIVEVLTPEAREEMGRIIGEQIRAQREADEKELASV